MMWEKPRKLIEWQERLQRIEKQLEARKPSEQLYKQLSPTELAAMAINAIVREDMSKLKVIADSIEQCLCICQHPDLMCQHLSGQKVKQLLAAFRSWRARHSHCWNAVVVGCKTLRCSQTHLFLPVLWIDKVVGVWVRFSWCEKSSLKPHYPNSHLCGSCSE